MSNGQEDDKHQQVINNLRSWHIYSALFAIFLAAGKVVFSAGGTDARMEEQMSTLRQRIEQDEKELARKDVLEQRLTGIEKSQAQAQQTLAEQSRTLEEIKIEIKRKN